jgi:hypothetical protein
MAWAREDRAMATFLSNHDGSNGNFKFKFATPRSAGPGSSLRKTIIQVMTSESESGTCHGVYLWYLKWLGFFRPARPGRDHRISSSLSPSGSRICCNMLRPPLQRVAALRPGRRPAGRCRAPPGPPPDRFRSARTASLPAGPVLSCRPRCQPAGWPCAYGTGRAARQASIRSRSSSTVQVRTLAGLLASSLRPQVG